MEKGAQITVLLYIVALYTLHPSVESATVRCPPGYARLGLTCYKLGRCADWSTAESRCESDSHGFLYKAESESFGQMKNLLLRNSPSCEHGYWVGARRHLPVTTFNWKDGTYLPDAHSYWAPGQPDPHEGAQCVEMRTASGFNGLLNDHICNIQKDYVCQACHLIDNCNTTACPSPSQTKCTECNHNNYFYKITNNGRSCEKMCAWNNHYCWPGHCSGDLTKNCVCSPGFVEVSTSRETTCQPLARPSIETCDLIAIGPNGEKKRSGTNGPINDCQYKTDFYGNYRPDVFHYTHHSSFQVDVSKFPSKPTWIETQNFGVTDVRLEIVSRNVQGGETSLKNSRLLTDISTSQNAKPTFSPEGNVTLPSINLQNGESICLKHIVYGGGFLKAKDTSKSNHLHLSATSYRKTTTSRTICYKYDAEAPKHCLEIHNCSIEPLKLQTRISRTSSIDVEFKGWFDPIPAGGNAVHASSIESYEIRVTEVSGNVKLQAGTSSVFSKKVNATENHVTLNITTTSPKLYCVTLEVKDVAGNVRQARRFFLFDNFTKITARSSKPFFVSSASKSTSYTWQTHHNAICLNWRDHFYNHFYFQNKLLNKIEPDAHGFIAGIYEQNHGPISVKGTENVYGIVKFTFAFSQNSSSFSSEVDVPNLKSQSYCKSFSLKDGDTYHFKIGATDIVNNTFSETKTVHVDRSVPEINNIWLVKESHKRVFVHGKTDLSTMDLQFDAYDIHSGIKTVEWSFGSADSNKNSLLKESIGVSRKANCSESAHCYCPHVGQECENLRYSIPLNKLINKNKHIGDHNQNYYFAIKVTNNADLFNIEHMDVLVDDSPPQTGVVLEGSVDGPDIDFTSADSFLVHWHGFIDHESGIRLYKVGLAERCLTIKDFYQDNGTSDDWNIDEIEAPENTIRLPANFTGKRYVSVIALNNAMEPSQPACSDGITKDISPPVFHNVRLANAKWAETIYCSEYATFLLRSDLVKVNISGSKGCDRTCSKSNYLPFLESLPDEGNTEFNSPNKSIGTVNSDIMEVTDFICSNIPLYKGNTLIYVPNDHIFLNWEIKEEFSQIQDFYVGFGQDASESNAPSLLNYVSTNRKSFFKLHHAGLGTDTEFFIFLKGVNKAGLKTVVTVGPVLIDQTPPRFKTVPTVKIEGHSIHIGWENDTFYDDEQMNPINKILFEIGHDNTIVTPLLEWRKDSSLSCKEFSGGCFKYPLTRLQRHDNQLGLNFYAILHVYNNAGHFVTLRTPTFKLPSKYRPGHAVIIDLDPNNHTNISHDKSKDVDAHFTAHTLCIAWNGFDHHENVTLEIGVGSNKSVDNIYAFSKVNDTGFRCIYSHLIPLETKLFAILKATCTGGSTISRSNGVVIYDKTQVLNSFYVYNGPKCFSDRHMLFRRIMESEIKVNDSVSLNHSLITGKVYTLRLTGSDNAVRKLRVANATVIITSNKTEDKRLDIVLQTTEDLSELFIVSVSNESVFLKTIELYDCKEELKIENNPLQVDVHWSELTQNFAFEYSLVSVYCSDMLNSSCIQHITPIKTTREDAVTLTDLDLQRHVNYSIIVSPCLNGKCLSAKNTAVFQTDSFDSHLKISKSEISLDNSNCMNVVIKWLMKDTSSQITFYQWSIVSKSQNTTFGLRNIPWQTAIHLPTRDNHLYVSECVNISRKHAFKTLFSCVRAFTQDGNKVQQCQKMSAITNIQPSDVVYDFDANTNMWNNIKEVLHSFYLGEKLKDLHNHEIDFATLDTKIAGAVLHGYDRNITWFLMRDRSVPTRCSDPPICVDSVVSRTGFAVFATDMLSANVVHYICANAEETEVTRETSTEMLPEINTCSDGFLIDTIPPYRGKMTVESINGYINNLQEFTVSWSGFKDNIKLGTLGYYNSIQSYTVYLGTRPGGKDLKLYGVFGEENDINIRDLAVKNGTSVYVTVIAYDHAGLNTSVVSKEVVVDTSPPIVGHIVQDGVSRTGWINSNILRARLFSFEDLESGIDYFVAYVGTSDYNDDVVKATKFNSDRLELLLNNTIVDGHFYFLRVKAVNRAGLSSLLAVMKFAIDRSPPTGGHVLDGLENNQMDLDFQTRGDYIAAHWLGFTDPHSGIHHYKAGLGTEPYLDDVEPMTSTGLKTSTVWNSTFTTGEKYFVTIEACNEAFLCRILASDGIILDDSPPIQGLVRVGSLSNHQTYIPRNSSVEMFWAGFEDPQSGIDRFEACIGTSPGRCNVTPVFNCLLASSHIKTNLNMPEKTDLFVTVTAHNKNNVSVSKSSKRFRVDATPPKVLRKPLFYRKFVSHQNSSAQWEKSVLRISWKFVDNESPIIRHVITLVTHHEGHTPLEQIELGSEDKVTLTLDDKHWLQNGDVYKALVTSCNAAGLCTTVASDGLLIDSTPPHLGGFKPPMTWDNFIDSNGTANALLNLSWYGFHDQESGIKCFHIGIGKSYSGHELSNGLLAVAANTNSSSYTSVFSVNQAIKPDDKIIVSIMAENNAGLISPVSRLTLTALATTANVHTQRSKGLLEIEKHSCDIHFCNKDCTCAVVGLPCTMTQTNMTCTNLQPTATNHNSVTVKVFGGMPGEQISITASSACLAAYWKVEQGESVIKRFEWSMGIKDGKPGEEIFDKNEIPWKDVGKLKYVVHCLPQNKSLRSREMYTVYVRAWVSADQYLVFHSYPLMADTTSPSVTKGNHINDSDSTCVGDYDVIDWADTATACWDHVFIEQQGKIIYYQVALGTTPGADDVVSKTNVGLNTSFTASGLSLTGGERYFFSVTVFNDVGLQTTNFSDGFLVDFDQPLTGVVYNTDRHRNNAFQSSSSTFELSWHGFLDHESGIKAYFSAVMDYENRTLVTGFVDFGIHTVAKFSNLSLKHGRKYIGAVKAADVMDHESVIVYSEAKLIDTTPPVAFTCRDKTIVYESILGLNESCTYTFSTKFETNAVYIISGIVGMANSHSFLRVSVDNIERHNVPLQTKGNETFEFQYNIVPESTGNHTINLDIGVPTAVIKEVAVSKCAILVKQHTFDALRATQVSPHIIKASVNVIDPESSVKRIWLGAGTRPGGIQHKSFYQIDKLSDEYVSISASHGTPVYVTAIVENYAGLRATFYSQKLMVDHTPPEVKDINVTIQSVHGSNKVHNASYDDETTVHLTATWNVSDPESGVKMCFTSVGSRIGIDDVQQNELARNGYMFVSKTITATHGKTLYVKVHCINKIGLATIRISEGVTVSIETPKIQHALVQFIPTLAQSRDQPHDLEDNVLLQSNKSRLQFYWTGFEDTSGIDHYEYRLASVNSRNDWTTVGRRSAVTLDGLHLTDGEIYTVEVSAVNSAHLRSDAINASILVDGRSPRLTGKPIQTNVTGRNMILDWKDVFEVAPSMPALFDLNVGSALGSADIADKCSLQAHEMVIQVPTSGFESRSIQELFISLRCWYPTGQGSEYRATCKI